MIEFVKGDIFESHCFAAVNPVNCVGVMGAGLAFQFKKRYPQMFNEYKKRCDNMEMKVGRNYFWMNPKALQSHIRCTDYGEFANIICFPTKYHWKDDSQIEWIKAGLLDLYNYVKVNYGHGCSIAIPKIGCGLGNLDWERDVKPEIIRILGKLEHIDIKVYE